VEAEQGDVSRRKETGAGLLTSTGRTDRDVHPILEGRSLCARSRHVVPDGKKKKQTTSVGRRFGFVRGRNDPLQPKNGHQNAMESRDANVGCRKVYTRGRVHVLAAGEMDVWLGKTFSRLSFKLLQREGGASGD